MKSRITYQYIAGFIDGEGHISLIRRIKKGRDEINYMPCFMVCNTHKEVLKMIREKIGGRWVESINISSYSGRDKLYRIIISKAEALNEVLPKIIPYLIIKRENAELVLRFIRSRLKARKRFKNHGKPIGTSPPYSDREREIYLEIEKNMPRGHK